MVVETRGGKRKDNPTKEETRRVKFAKEMSQTTAAEDNDNIEKTTEMTETAEKTSEDSRETTAGTKPTEPTAPTTVVGSEEGNEDGEGSEEENGDGDGAAEGKDDENGGSEEVREEIENVEDKRPEEKESDYMLKEISHTMKHFGRVVKENTLWPLPGFCVPLEDIERLASVEEFVKDDLDERLASVEEFVKDVEKEKDVEKQKQRKK
ncbi:hypothetical protein Rs2_47536 [Raphanus sativus]|nr:hypothetical protein Rs2_47536 [Raphanus sativus]